ncbi:MAG: RIP metalloprotease RseP [Bacteroidota bacterium]|nr:RIP metalloprotease RseP [Bacteroidota bacterium]
MITLAINWSQVGLQAGYLLFSLSILVLLHEFGHYITAKWFKCRVDKFYLFFDPWFSVFKKKIGETEYGIGWLPLGGYCKIAGMVDESMDKAQVKQPPQPWEYRSKPAWQRLIILLAGITMNVLFAFFLYAMILYTWGDKKTPVANVTNGLSITDSLMYKVGFKDGDKILAVNDEPIVYYEDIVKKLLLGEKVSIERNREQTIITLPQDLLGQLVQKKRSGVPLFQERAPVIIANVPETSIAKQEGIKQYDRIIAIDSIPTPFYDILNQSTANKKGQDVQLKIIRGSDTMLLNAKVSKEGKLGFYTFVSPDDLDSLGIIKMQNNKYSFLASFPAGVKKTGSQLSFYIDQFKKILSPKTGAYKGLGGFKAMASIFPKNTWDWEAFWEITAFFSIVLAFMNLLPIPALDGGHVLFTLIEMITGRKPSDKFLEYAQIAGMILLFALMIFANGNDWFGWGRGH